MDEGVLTSVANNERTNNYLIIEPLQIFVGPIWLLKSGDCQYVWKTPTIELICGRYFYRSIYVEGTLQNKKKHTHTLIVYMLMASKITLCLWKKNYNKFYCECFCHFWFSASIPECQIYEEIISYLWQDQKFAEK